MTLKKISRWQLKNKYFFASVAVFILVILRSFVFRLIGNESVYLLPARRLIDPTFLANDWTVGAGAGGGSLSIVFSSLMTPLWLLLKDSLAVALTGRVLVWILLLYALARLGKQIEIQWYAFTFGIGIWLFSGQSLAAGEWMFGGVEQKCLAYAFLILSLASLIQSQIIRAGIFCGLSICCHVLVGGYGAIALTTALLVCRREYGFWRVVKFALTAAVIGLPLLLIAIQYTALGSSSDIPVQPGINIESFLVVFRNPHHLDPNYFLDPKRLIEVILYGICTYFAVTFTVARTKAKLLLAFLGVLLAIFIAGLVARQVEAFWFLEYYPFRVADTLLPLIFWLTMPALIIQQGQMLLRRPEFKPNHSPLMIPLTLLMAVPIIWQVPGVVLEMGRASKRFIPSIWQYTTQTEDTFEEISHWIRDYTEKSATVIVHPCKSNFWITAERAMVVNQKAAPSNVRVLEWHHRMVNLNGNKKFKEVGFEICEELEANFPYLDLQHLLSIRQAYDADYYLTTVRRTDLEKTLIYHNRDYYLYDLSGYSLQLGQLR